jgi:hypothetical protein
VQLTSALQDIGTSLSPLSSLAWMAYVHAITAEFAQGHDPSQPNVAAFSIVQFLDQCLIEESVELEHFQARTLDVISRMLRRQIMEQANHFRSAKHFHMCALLAAFSLKKQDVTAATFFADETSRLMKLNWHSLLLKRCILIEPLYVADLVVVCQCALLNSDFTTARGMCAKIMDAGKAKSYFSHAILLHGHVLNALINLLHGNIRSSSFHLESAKAFGACDFSEGPTAVPEFRYVFTH